MSNKVGSDKSWSSPSNSLVQNYLDLIIWVNVQFFFYVVNAKQVGMPIPRRFSFLGDSGNRGMAICHSSGIGETKTYSPGFGSGFGGISGSTLSQIWSQFEISLYWKDFFRKNFLNQKNSMIFMIRNVKISIKDNQIFKNMKKIVKIIAFGETRGIVAGKGC